MGPNTHSDLHQQPQVNVSEPTVLNFCGVDCRSKCFNDHKHDSVHQTRKGRMAGTSVGHLLRCVG